MEAQLNLVETWDEAESFMRWLGERHGTLACDTETGGLEFWREPLRLVQFGDPVTGWAIPWQTWGGLAKEALRLYRGDLVFHNMKFDCHFLEDNGCDVGRFRVHDTRTVAHLLDARSGTGLKPLAVRYVDPAADAGQSDLKKGMALNKWDWRTVPTTFEPYWAYSALDPVLTARLWELLRPQLNADQVSLYELEVACQFVLLDMECRGARVDVEYCERARSQLLDSAAAMRAWCAETYGFEPGQNKKVASQFQRENIVLKVKTDSGAWSLKKEVLEGLLPHPLAKCVLGTRKTEHYGKAYFGNYIKFADADGILHPDVNPLGAKTGRQGVSRPALQQVPRTKLLRDPFIPRDGHRLVTVDFDQIEFRLLSHFANDPGLAEAFAEADAGGADFFTLMARGIYGDTSIEKGDPRRQVTKNAAYAKGYGAGVAKFALTAGVPEAEAAAFLAALDARYPGIRDLQRRVDVTAKRRYAEEGMTYVTTPMGRRQVVDPGKEYKLTNYLVQGTAADVFKATLIELDRAGLADRLVLPVHDECVFDVPAEEADDFAVEVQRVFAERGKMFSVPLTAGSDVLERWGDKYENPVADEEPGWEDPEELEQEEEGEG